MYGDEIFECVEMKQQGAEQLRGKIDQLTDQQKLAFWAKRSSELKQQQAKAKAQIEPPKDMPSAEPGTTNM